MLVLNTNAPVGFKAIKYYALQFGLSVVLLDVQGLESSSGDHGQVGRRELELLSDVGQFIDFGKVASVDLPDFPSLFNGVSGG